MSQYDMIKILYHGIVKIERTNTQKMMNGGK